MTRFKEPPPADAQVAGNIKIHRKTFAGTEDGGMSSGFTVKIWRGKAQAPYAHYAFKTDAARERYIAQEIAAAEDVARIKAERKIEARAETVAMRAAMPVGTVLHYSWGWEQTQCEFFEVTRRTEASAWIRPIKARPTARRSGFDSCYMRPCPGAFDGDEVRKAIGPCGLKMAHGHASPAEDRDYYCSWYG